MRRIVLIVMSVLVSLVMVVSIGSWVVARTVEQRVEKAVSCGLTHPHVELSTWRMLPAAVTGRVGDVSVSGGLKGDGLTGEIAATFSGVRRSGGDVTADSGTAVVKIDPPTGVTLEGGKLSVGLAGIAQAQVTPELADGTITFRVGSVKLGGQEVSGSMLDGLLSNLTLPSVNLDELLPKGTRATSLSVGTSTINVDLKIEPDAISAAGFAC